MIRIAQALLALGALALWGASRLPWVEVQQADGLGQPRTVALSGAQWSTGLVPLALVLLAAAMAALAVRGWTLRLLAVLIAASSAAMAYLGISLWVVHDVAVRGAELAEFPVAALGGTAERHFWGAGLALAAAVIALVAAGLLMRSAATARTATTRYAAPAARRDAVRSETSDSADPQGLSERMMWDALDEGSDPTRDDPDNKGR